MKTVNPAYARKINYRDALLSLICLDRKVSVLIGNSEEQIQKRYNEEMHRLQALQKTDVLGKVHTISEPKWERSKAGMIQVSIPYEQISLRTDYTTEDVERYKKAYAELYSQ